jgi:peptidyl-prolyl cis-trans isomerase A (cyclophilin A)
MSRQPGLYATFETSEGTIVCRLFEKDAPKTVANFVELAEGKREWTHPSTRKKSKDRLYDGTIFHRVIPDFMIQGGDPLGNGQGDPGYKFKNETSPDLTFDRPGRLAYANAGPDTNGSQFFITEVPYPSLDGHYTIFGQCDQASVELVKKIARMPRNGNDLPDNPVKINKITILHMGAAPAHAPMHKPAAKAAPAKQQ